MAGVHARMLTLAKAPVIDISPRTVTKLGNGAGTITSTYRLENDGDVSNHDLIVLERWIQNSTNYGGYECRATVTSGTLTSGTTGTWLALSTSRSWSRDAGAATLEEAVITVEIRDATTLEVKDSASITIRANNLG